MNRHAISRPTRVRFGVLGFAGTLAMITYLDRVCFGTVAPLVQAEFGLGEEQLGLLFTAFALAYAAFEVPSGRLGDLHGPRRTLVRIVLWWSLFTALTGAVRPTPWWPLLGFLTLLAVRFLFGMGEAGAFPNVARALYNWFPLDERGFSQGVVWMCGRLMGGLTPLVVLLLLYRTQPADPSIGAGTQHWRHVFWGFGALGAAWCVAFAWWFRDRPEEHAGVNAAELARIRSGGADRRTSAAHGDVAWARLAASGNLWLLCLQYFCGSYGWYFHITWLPKYLKAAYGVYDDNPEYGVFWTSLMTGAPLLCGSLACLVGGLLTDRFVRRTGDRKWGRRLFGVAGHGTCAICFLLAAFAPSAVPFVLAMALASLFNDLTMGSAWAACLDIGGKHSGVVSGCMNTIGNLGGAAAGYTTGWVVGHFGPAQGWPIHFISCAAIYGVAALLWLGFDATKPVFGCEERSDKRLDALTSGPAD